MKMWKKIVSLFTVLALCLSVFQGPVAAASADADSIIAELIMYYQNYQDEAQTDIDRLLEDLEAVDSAKAQSWREIMAYWSEINQPGFANEGALPEGLPTDDSMAIVILGFKLKSDGTMEDELVGRLQTGLEIAQAYPNAYVAVTGGGTAPNNPEATEGGLMGEWLLAQGLSEDRLIIEDRAPDTVGNAENTYAILAKDYPNVDSIVLVTSDYHVPRGCLLYNSKFILTAAAQGGEPLKIIANRGYETGSEGYETLTLQGNGVRSVAGISAKPTVILSELETLRVTQNTMYETGKDLDLRVDAIYTSGYERDVTEFVTIEGFDKESDATQTITVSYSEGETTVSVNFTLTEASRTFANKAKLFSLIEEVEAKDPTVYTASSYALLETALYAAHEAYNDELLTHEAMKEVYNELSFRLATLRKPVNVVPYARVVTANDGLKNDIKKIYDGSNSTYWESDQNVQGIDGLVIDIELDGMYDLNEIVVRPYHSTKTEDNTVRSYFYEVYVSNDGVDYEMVAKHTATGTTNAGNKHPLDVDYTVKYIRIKGTGKVNPGSQTNQTFHLSEVYAYGEEVGNILTGKKFTSTAADTSYASSADALPEKAFDGDRVSYFDMGGYKTSPWMIVDLEEVYALDKVNVINYYAKARYYQYEVYASIDGNKYFKIAEKSDNSNSTVHGNTFTFETPAYGRYLKVVGTHNSANSAFHLNEFRAYGRVATAEDAEGIQKQEAAYYKQELQEIVDSYIRSDYISTTWDEFVGTRDAVKARLVEELTLEEIDTLKATLEAADDVLVKGNPDVKPEGTFRLASFNIWAPNPAHPNVEGINELLLRVDADYAGIQEVDRNNTRDNRDVITLIADDDYQSNYQKAIDYKSGEYGIGQLSSTEMLEKTGGSYAKVNNEEGRAWMRMLVEIDGKQVAIYNTHLSVGEDNAEANALNISELLTLLDNDPVPYKLVTGDYNATKEKMDPVKENYNLANGQDGIWYSTFEGDKYAEGQGYLDGIPSEIVTSGIDNIIYSRNIELENFRVVHSNGLSDHYLIYGDFKLLAYEEDLQAYVDTCNYDAKFYTAASWAAYEEAYNAALAMLANEDFEQLQDECKAALEALEAATAQLELIPDYVENLTAEGTDYKTVTLNWTTNGTVDKFVVERLSGEEWIQLGETNDTTYVAAGLKTGKAYTFRVNAVVNGTVYEYPETYQTITPSLSGEVELSIAMNGDDKFDLTWTQVDGATRYIIYRKEADGEWKKLLTLGKDANSYTTRTMEEGTYFYQVKAARYDSVDRVMTNGSNEVSATVSEQVKALNVNVESSADGVTLSWTKDKAMDYYEVYRATNGGTYRLMKRTTSTTVTSTGLKAGKTYSYKVRGCYLVNGAKAYTDFSEEFVYSVE